MSQSLFEVTGVRDIPEVGLQLFTGAVSVSPLLSHVHVVYSSFVWMVHEVHHVKFPSVYNLIKKSLHVDMCFGQSLLDSEGDG